MEKSTNVFKILTSKTVENDIWEGVVIDAREKLAFILMEEVSIRGVGLIRLLIGIIG